jgi:preprotein translocase subunit Sec63
MPLFLWGVFMLILGVSLGYLISKWEAKFRRKSRMEISERFVEDLESKVRKGGGR